MSNTLKIKKVGYFWVYIALGILAIIVALFLAPFWGNIWNDCPWKNWGIDALKILISIGILCYLFGYLLRKIIRSRGTIQILSIVEAVLLFLIALGGIFTQFNIIKISEACMIFGLILWCEGGIDLFRAYFHQRDSVSKYPIWRLCLAIALVTFGTYIFAKPIFTNLVVLWAFVVILFLCGIMAIIIGVYSKPAGKAKTKKSPKKKKSNTKPTSSGSK